MALLTASFGAGTTLARASWRRAGLAALALALPLAAFSAPAFAEAASEYQIKAVFLFNFTQFVDWPSSAFADAQSPFVIGVLGEDPFHDYLDDAVRGERVDHRPLVVRRCRNLAEAATCQILFISRSESARLPQILAELHGRNILTVGDADEFTARGGVIRLLTKRSKIRLRINVAAAKAAGLTISSQLLRPSELVSLEPSQP